MVITLDECISRELTRSALHRHPKDLSGLFEVGPDVVDLPANVSDSDGPGRENERDYIRNFFCRDIVPLLRVQAKQPDRLSVSRRRESAVEAEVLRAIETEDTWQAQNRSIGTRRKHHLIAEELRLAVRGIRDKMSSTPLETFRLTFV